MRCWALCYKCDFTRFAHIFLVISSHNLCKFTQMVPVVPISLSAESQSCSQWVTVCDLQPQTANADKLYFAQCFAGNTSSTCAETTILAMLCFGAFESLNTTPSINIILKSITYVSHRLCDSSVFLLRRTSESIQDSLNTVKSSSYLSFNCLISEFRHVDLLLVIRKGGSH